jgi:sterol 24-C-methyltransferase
MIHTLEKGNGIPKLSTIPECVQALKQVGFEMVESYDLVEESIGNPSPWYTPLQGSFVNPRQLPMTPIGRWMTNSAMVVLETLGMVPPGTCTVSKVLNDGADALVQAGELRIFTPMYFFLVRKPL